MANQTLFGILNGIANTAKSSNDMNAMSVAEELWQRAYWAFGTTYDSATSYTTTNIIQAVPLSVTSTPPASWDAELNVSGAGIIIKQLGG